MIKKNFNLTQLAGYLLTSFVITIVLFFSIPKLFNFNSKLEHLNTHLSKNELLIIKNFKKINYKIFPIPLLEISDPVILIDKNIADLKAKKLTLKINLLGIYNFKKMSIREISIDQASIELNLDYLNNFFRKINKKINFTNSIFIFSKDKNNIIELKNFNLKNKNKNHLIMVGNFAGVKIEGNFLHNRKNNILKINLKDLGISSKIVFDSNSSLLRPSGQMKLRILKNNILINFKKNQKGLSIKNSFFKNRLFHSNINGIIVFTPYFNFNLLLDVKKIKVKDLKINKVFSLFDRKINNKKINGNLKINYELKESYLKNIFLNLNFINGNIHFYESSLDLQDGNLSFDIATSDYEGYKKLDFRFDLNSKNKDKLYEHLKIKKKENKNKVNLKVFGHININAKKIYFERVETNENKIEELRLNYFKKIVEDHFENLNINNLTLLELQKIIFKIFKTILA